MRLVSFAVRRFRNVLDSTEIDVDPDVTCLVGKNESGKTALLQALWRAKPHVSTSFSSLEDYPRWRLNADRKAGEVDSAAPIQVTFELDDDDVKLVESLVMPGILINRTFTVQKRYNGTDLVTLLLNEQMVVNDLITRCEFPTPYVPAALATYTTLHDLQVGIQGLEVDQSSDEGVRTTELLTQITERITALIGDSTLWHRLETLLKERMPTFFYFSDYQMLPGRIDLEELRQGADHPGATGLQTARALLQLAATDVDAISEDEFEERVAELEAVSEDLTRQVREYWRQNQDLSVQVLVDKANVVNNTQYGQSISAVARYLDLRVRDGRHGFTNNFARRSSGFRWFFSFLAAFSEFEQGDQAVIVLLDEPALTLHGRAQADFLRFIEQRLAPRCQVLYTTHSPFMVDVNHLERVRVVEDKGPQAGAVATSEVLGVDPDTIFPLQGALGYEVAQSVFIGDANLLVEGTSDFTYLTVMSDLLRDQGRAGLNERWRVLPAGSSANVPAFVALLGRGLDVTVLVDASTNGMQRLNHLAEQGLLAPHRLITVAAVTDTKQADIEDVFALDDYLTLYNGAFSTTLTSGALPPGDRIVDRIGRADGQPFTAHGRPADWLLRNRATVLDGLAATTLNRFEALFNKVNATLPT